MRALPVCRHCGGSEQTSFPFTEQGAIFRTQRTEKPNDPQVLCGWITRDHYRRSLGRQNGFTAPRYEVMISIR
jgi:hypothetical protein